MRVRRMNGAFPDSLRTRMQAFGRDVAAARKARSLSQQDLAGRLSVSRMTVSRLERGDHAVGFDTVLCAAWVMGLEDTILSSFAAENDPAQLRFGRLAIPERVRRRSATSSVDLDF